MKKLLTPVKNKLSLIVIVIPATAVGGLATTLVQAVIPDSGRTIHGCYTNNNGSLKVIDSRNLPFKLNSPQLEPKRLRRSNSI